MALPASHLRFADAVRPFIRDRSAYFSGTVYPDSRWVSGIAREATHGPQCLQAAFDADEFGLGWRLHCLCDNLQAEIHRSLLPGLDQLTADERWIVLAAAKVIQDMHDAARADLPTIIPHLVDSRAPSGESDADVAVYLAAVRHAYRGGTTPTWEDYTRLWLRVGLDRETVERIERAVAHLRDDPTIVAQLHGSFRQLTDTYRAMEGRADDAGRGAS